MTGKQITVIACTLAITGTLFYLGYKTSRGVNDPSAQAASASAAFDFDSYLSTQKESLPATLKSRITALEGGEKNNKENLLNLARLWDSSGQKLASAHYVMAVAEAAPGETNWYFAGSKFYDIASTEQDSARQAYAAGEAQKAFEKVLELNPRNADAKNALAIIHVQINQDVMKGVGLLKEVVEQDSNNVQAIFTLGVLSIRSNQFEKAQQRFEKLVALQPFNAEYYFYLAETYAKTGEKEKAIRTYETCRTLMKDDNAKKEVETIINQLKTL